MIIPVRMLAFHDKDTVRPVFIPDDKWHSLGRSGRTGREGLEAVYYYGQNNFIEGPDADTIRRTTCSVSVGDVIELPNQGGNFLVVAMGFYRLGDEEYEAYKGIPERGERITAAYTKKAN